MASYDGEEESEAINSTPVRRPKRRIWFLNNDLIRVDHINRPEGILTFYNITQNKREIVDLVEFKKHRKRAFTVAEAAQLLNCHKKYLSDLAKRGVVPEPIGGLPGGRRAFHHLSYYSEDGIMEAREAMSKIHQGKPRKDGLITNNKIPTAQELRYAMGDGILLYTRTEDGRFIPIFSETI
ncbi:MAG TPA: hypothetical protein PLI52_04295 [Prochlorococcaceae cyanobacterium AMR_MDS_5431]|nr:hypothetical protein [Prochlorococcaceae cyanobacterium AMR_MDS_5431]